MRPTITLRWPTRAWRPGIKRRRYGTGSDEPPHRIAATYFPGVYFEKDQYDFYVDITDWFERRVQAEMAFRSQGHTDEFARRRIAVTLGNIGWYAGVMYAESFVREKPEVLRRG